MNPDPNSLGEIIRTLGGVGGVVSAVLVWVLMKVMGLLEDMRKENARLTDALVTIAMAKKCEEAPKP